MSLHRIIMRLARNPEAGFADGDDRYGYTLAAPLTADGHLDEAAWAANKAKCTVRAFAPDSDTREGRLARRGNNWFFDYDQKQTDDDEPVFKLDTHSFAVGEYLTVTDEDGEPLVYRVSQIERLD